MVSIKPIILRYSAHIKPRKTIKTENSIHKHNDLKLAYIYRNYPKIKAGVPLFLDHPVYITDALQDHLNWLEFLISLGI